MPSQPDSSALANRIQQAAPQGATGYILRRQGCPLGNGSFEFPVPYRKTKHTDGTLRNTSVYQLWPFETPRVPWVGVYDLHFWIPAQGMVLSPDPESHDILLGKSDIVPRAAFDEHALWLWVPPSDGTDAGSTEAIHREVMARAPAGAIGYFLRMHGTGPDVLSFTFPPRGRPSRRANGSFTDVPYYSLNPFELPCVPWAGTYSVAFELPHGIVHFNPEQALQPMRVGVVFPHADREKITHVKAITRGELPMGSPTLLLSGKSSPRRILRKLRPVGK